MSQIPGGPTTRGAIGSMVQVRKGEWLPLCLSFLYFLLLLASYYCVRAVRDTVFTLVDQSERPTLFLTTFLVMIAVVPLFGWLATRFERRQFLPAVYWFFLANLIVIYATFDQFGDSLWYARFFFTWVSVFNLFVVSVFWGFMADIFAISQSRRLFGIIAAGGSVGGIVGALLGGFVAKSWSVSAVILTSSLLLFATILVVWRLLGWCRSNAISGKSRMGHVGGDIWDGIKLLLRFPFLQGIAGFIFLGTFTGVILYSYQASVIAERYVDAASRTQAFANVDLAVNASIILIQVLLLGRVIRWIGFLWALLILPLVVVATFAVIAVSPALGFILVAQIVRRAILFAITNPTSQMLYAVVGPRTKYKFKAMADTLIYRGGDTSGVFLFRGAEALGGLGLPAAIGMLGGVLWIGLTVWLGKRLKTIQSTGKVIP